jgi:uncharacterized protein (UPF0335 family)
MRLNNRIMRRMTTPQLAKDLLRSYVDRIERVNEEIKELSNDKRDIYAEAKSNGFDVKAVKEIIKIRAQDPGAVKEHDMIVETYLVALGMIPGETGAKTPAQPRHSRDTERDTSEPGRWSEEAVA